MEARVTLASTGFSGVVRHRQPGLGVELGLVVRVRAHDSSGEVAGPVQQLRQPVLGAPPAERAAVGFAIPRTTFTQWPFGVRIPNNQAQPGDLVFFNSGPGASSVWSSAMAK
ncbi:hypothetical protein [Actinomadura luteofluorescens]|uniref:hypothetical protein n=1 Tax=Actinomadura luteofluorescens TaxID=46163 RepID=UPI003D90D931